MRLKYCCVGGLICITAMAGPILGQVREAEDTEAVRTEKPSGNSEVDERPDIAASIMERTNQFRQRKDRSKVEASPELTDAAAYFSRYMARTNRYGHTADGQRPSERAKKHGYSYCIVSENIAYQYSSAGFEDARLVDRFVQGWKNSPGHRRNMLARHVTETGVAVSQSKETGYIYAVQMFGRPKEDSIQFEVSNQSEREVEYQIGDRSYPLPPRYTRTHDRCRPAKLTFTWRTDGQQQTEIVKPRDGDKIVIAKQHDQINIQSQ